MAGSENLVSALTRLIEANAALRKRRALSKPERALTAKMASAFRAEAKAFLSRLALLSPYFPPEVGTTARARSQEVSAPHIVQSCGPQVLKSCGPQNLESCGTGSLTEIAQVVDWGPAFDEAALATLQAFTLPLDEFTAKALEAGMLGAVADLDVTTSFTLENPRAVDFLRNHGAESAIGISATTRQRLRTLLTQAAEEGWSYDRTAKEITNLYGRFAGPPSRRYRHIPSRAHAIAVFELGNAYEYGNMLVAKDLQAGGLTMEKSWLSVGDARVRPDHRANQAQGWIALDATFQDGSERPPTDSGCRCALLLRRKPDE